MNYRAAPTPLHTHEITPDDTALCETLTGLEAADDRTVALSSAKTITGAAMRR
ncbi:hypothetical protein LO763_22330 [Glycomyces sp. A-F 0318]|uniref:hypothetical protein n=1 Tax=Glycomyces amatae TaxID=2881355 RepID=UPI001E3366FA|nr:hypothetical protein [Glycomyces amatae]MCD0446356.1 hypothetical protein [Glycomyces amatae]